MKKLFYVLAACLSLTSIHASLISDVIMEEISKKGDFSVDVDWLYWKTDQARLNFATGVKAHDDNTRLSSKALKPKFKYHNGVRIAAGFTTKEDLWTFKAIYTYIPSTARTQFASTSANQFSSLMTANFPLLSPLSTAPFTTLKSHWKSDIHTWDLDISKVLSVYDSLEIVPHLGLRILQMDQRFSLKGLRLASASSDVISFKNHMKGKFTGVGLEAGIKGNWEIYDGLFLTGHVGGSILYAHVNNRSHLKGIDSAENATSTSYRDSSHNGIPTFDTFIGLQYKNSFWEHPTNIYLGWEQHLIYQTNDFSLAESGSTTLQGATLGCEILF